MDHTRRTALLSAAALCYNCWEGCSGWLCGEPPVPAAAPAAVAASHRQLGVTSRS